MKQHEFIYQSKEVNPICRQCEKKLQTAWKKCNQTSLLSGSLLKYVNKCRYNCKVLCPLDFSFYLIRNRISWRSNYHCQLNSELHVFWTVEYYKAWKNTETPKIAGVKYIWWEHLHLIMGNLKIYSRKQIYICIWRRSRTNRCFVT